MATKTAADPDSTIGFRTPDRQSSTAAATEVGETTYWPGLRESGDGADPFANPGMGSNTEHLPESPRPKVTPLIRLTRQRMPDRRFQVKEQFEGVVTRIDGEWFEADLRDLQNPDSPMEVAE